MPFKPHPFDPKLAVNYKYSMIVENRNSMDQNFVVMGALGPVSTTPSGSPSLTLAWMAGQIPGMTGGISSKGSFYWNDDYAIVLGQITQAGAGRFVAGTTVPVSIDGNNSLAVGFIGETETGSLKLQTIGKTGGSTLAVKTDSSLPNANQQKAGSKCYCAAWSFGRSPDSGNFENCNALQLLPNMVASLSPNPKYSVVSVNMTVQPDDVLLKPIVDEGFPFSFDGVDRIQLVYTEKNEFTLP